MAFDVFVSKSEPETLPPEDPKGYDAWLVEFERNLMIMHPLGGDDEIELMSRIGCKYNLTIICKIHEQGFRSSSQVDLLKLKKELVYFVDIIHSTVEGAKFESTSFLQDRIRMLVDTIDTAIEEEAVLAIQ